MAFRGCAVERHGRSLGQWRRYVNLEVDGHEVVVRSVVLRAKQEINALRRVENLKLVAVCADAADLVRRWQFLSQRILHGRQLFFPPSGREKQGDVEVIIMRNELSASPCTQQGATLDEPRMFKIFDNLFRLESESKSLVTPDVTACTLQLARVFLARGGGGKGNLHF